MIYALVHTIDVTANVWARLLDPTGTPVPGSDRYGHNVLTNFGREWVAQLVRWTTINTTDVPATEHRIRWFGVGEGTQPAVESVTSLNTPLPITAGIFLVPLSEPVTFPTAVSARFHHIFGLADISFGGDKTVTELALYADSSPGLTLVDTIGTQTPVAYKVLDVGLVKTSGFSLELFWELKF